MEILAAKWNKLKEQMGGPNSETWQQYCGDLIEQHNVSLSKKSDEAMTSGNIAESKVIEQANKALLQTGRWLQPFDIHLLTIILPGHYRGHASLKSAGIVTASPALEQFWREKCPPFPELFEYVLCQNDPQHSFRLCADVEKERRKEDITSTHSLTSAVSRRLKVLFVAAGILSRNANRFPYRKVPNLLASRQYRLKNCPPVNESPVLGTFSIEKLTQSQARGWYDALGCWLSSDYLASVDRQGKPIVSLEKWSAEEQGLKGNSRSAIILMSDRIGTPLLHFNSTNVSDRVPPYHSRDHPLQVDSHGSSGATNGGNPPVSAPTVPVDLPFTADNSAPLHDAGVSAPTSGSTVPPDLPFTSDNSAPPPDAGVSAPMSGSTVPPDLRFALGISTPSLNANTNIAAPMPGLFAPLDVSSAVGVPVQHLDAMSNAYLSAAFPGPGAQFSDISWFGTGSADHRAKRPVYLRL